MTPNEYAELVIIADAMEEAGDPSRHLLRRIVEQVDGLLAELSRLRSSPAPVVGGVPVLDHAALWDLFREDYYTVSRDAFDKVMRFTVSQIASRLRSSPAPVVGGVRDWLTTSDVIEAFGSWEDSKPWAYIADDLNRIVASRLHALKPGEVVAIEKIIAVSRVCANEGGTDRRCCVQTDDHHIALLELDKIRAQPTPTEKETGHAGQAHRGR